MSQPKKNALAVEFDVPIVVSTHLRTQKKIDTMGVKELHPNVRFLKAFGFCDYNKLQIDSLCVISDSRPIIEEGSILNLPATVIPPFVGLFETRITRPICTGSVS
jgi:UDP-N-acetyl-L-fucosamine synthase